MAAEETATAVAYYQDVVFRYWQARRAHSAASARHARAQSRLENYGQGHADLPDYVLRELVLEELTASREADQAGHVLTTARALAHEAISRIGRVGGIR